MAHVSEIEPTKLRTRNTRRRPEPELKVAIIHYWLVNMRGGEKVLEELCEMFPQADIFTHVYAPGKVSDTIRQHTVKTTFISRLPFARTKYQKYLPFMPSALEQLDLSKYDLVISSEAGPAKGVIVRPDALHICYCHSPMRYIWDQYTTYRKSAGFITRLVMPYLTGKLRQWDVTSAARVDYFVANSTTVASRIQKYWRREAEVVPPPVDTARFDPSLQREDFYLYVGEMVPYKRADIAIKACTMMDRRLIVIGDGPDAKQLRDIAGPKVEFLGRVPDDILAEHYARCRALLFPGEEDFGIVPVEAMAAGAPVIAFGRGGVKDSVIPDVTGVFFDEQTPAGLIGGIARFEMIEHTFETSRLTDQAALFQKHLFKERFGTIVRRLLERRKPQGASDIVVRIESSGKGLIVPHQHAE